MVQLDQIWIVYEKNIVTYLLHYYCFQKTQTIEHKRALLKKYRPENLFIATRDIPAHNVADLACRSNDILGVIKRQNPMGEANVWFVDNGGELVIYVLSLQLCFR